jgi:hypothetical protein
MSEPSHPPSLPPAPSARKGLSTGCIIGLVAGAVGLFCLVIVAILASLAIPSFNKFQARGQALQVRMAMRDLGYAVQGYQIEYERLPDLAETDEQKPLKVQGLLLDILMGKNPDQNPREIAFFTPPAKGKMVLATHAAGLVELQDEFGNVFHMHIDWNEDGSIPDPERRGAMISEPVIVYSAGPDGDYGTWKDNVKSWGR